MRRGRKVITGEYSRYGYTVVLSSPAGERVVYSAGNHPRDSQAIGSDRLSLRQIRAYCIKTCREIAAERHAQYGDVMRVPEEET